MARSVPIAFALAALAAVLVIVFQGREQDPDAATPTGEAAREAARGNATLLAGSEVGSERAANGSGERESVPISSGEQSGAPAPQPCAIEGLVVDQDGAPVPELVLLLDRTPPYPTFPGDEDRWLKSFGQSLRGPIKDQHEWGRHLASATTGEQGEFRLELPGPGRWRLSTHAGAQPGGVPDVAATGLDLTVREGATRRVRIVVHIANYISGWVFLPDGSAPRETRVWTERREAETLADADGFFRLGPMVPGRFKLIGVGLRQDGRSLAGGPIDAESGQEEVEIWLRAPRELRGRVVDASGGVDAMVHGRHPETGAGFSDFSSADTGFVAGDLQEGIWQFVASTADGRFGKTEHAVPGLDVNDLGEVLVEVVDGATLELTNGSVKDMLRYALEVDGAALQSARMMPGQMLSLAIPAGHSELVLESLATNPELGGLDETGWSEVRSIEAQPGEVIPLVIVPGS